MLNVFLAYFHGKKTQEKKENKNEENNNDINDEDKDKMIKRNNDVKDINLNVNIEKSNYKQIELENKNNNIYKFYKEYLYTTLEIFHISNKI